MFSIEKAILLEGIRQDEKLQTGAILLGHVPNFEAVSLILSVSSNEETHLSKTLIR